jgi:ribosomal protein S18 acetylase RimI-like enzyme
MERLMKWPLTRARTPPAPPWRAQMSRHSSNPRTRAARQWRRQVAGDVASRTSGIDRSLAGDRGRKRKRSHPPATPRRRSWFSRGASTKRGYRSDVNVPRGVDADLLRFLERHEARVHALPGRHVRDLGDAILLHDPLDPEPFWNRVNAIQWPDAGRAFDRRLGETIALFATLDRVPHVWPRNAFNEPVDLANRLVAHGFVDVGGGHLMVLTDVDRSADVSARALSRGVTVERLHRVTGDERTRAAAGIARVLVDAFDVESDRRAAIQQETEAMFDLSDVHACLIRVDGEPAAAAKRATFGGATYLSSIGTRTEFRGRGLGELATATVTADAASEGSRWTYLGVFAGNDVAIRLYERLGFVRLGPPAPDLLLRSG